MRVVGSVLADGVEHVVVRDDPDEAVVFVHHGDGEKVEAGQLFHHPIARLLQADADRIPLHEVRYERGWPGEDQVAERHEADQLSIGVEYVNVVDRLAVGGLRPQAGHRLAGRDVGWQRSVFGRHQTAGRPLRAGEEHADVVPLGLRHQRQNFFDEFWVEFTKQVVAIVRGHPLDQRPQMDPVGRRHQLHLSGHGEVGEDFGLPFDRQEVEELPEFAVVEPFREIGHGGGVEFPGHLPQAVGISLAEHDAEFGNQNGIGGGHGGAGGRGGSRKRPAGGRRPWRAVRLY